MRKLHLFASLAIALPIASAETFQGIGPFQNLGDIQGRFPNATIAPVKAAWVTENEAFYALTGEGFPGTLYLAFDDYRPSFKKQIQEREAIGENAESLKRLVAEPNSRALEINWMRWVPASPIPVQRYFLKYGKQEKIRYSDTTMKPYYEWPEKGVLANVSDDEKTVISVEFNFTRLERKAACPTKYLKESCEMFVK